MKIVQSKYVAHGLDTLTKFHEDGAKMKDFLLKVSFQTFPIFWNSLYHLNGALLVLQCTPLYKASDNSSQNEDANFYLMELSKRQKRWRTEMSDPNVS